MIHQAFLTTPSLAIIYLFKFIFNEFLSILKDQITKYLDFLHYSSIEVFNYLRYKMLVLIWENKYIGTEHSFNGTIIWVF